MNDPGNEIAVGEVAWISWSCRLAMAMSSPRRSLQRTASVCIIGAMIEHRCYKKTLPLGSVLTPDMIAALREWRAGGGAADFTPHPNGVGGGSEG